MNDQDLLDIYDASYKEEYDEYYKIAYNYYQNARDKKYAIETGLNIIGLLLSFSSTSDLDKEIIHYFNHSYKLGFSVVEIIHSIPNLISQNRIKDDEWPISYKNDVSIQKKKLFGIPYGLKQVSIRGKIKIGSPFENLASEDEIARELGKQRALINLFEHLKDEYIKIDGPYESEKTSLLPIKFENLSALKESLAINDLDTFFKIIQSVFANMSYDMKITEGYFHSHIHLLLTLLDFNISAEVQTNFGRIDSVVESDNYLHIFELKQNDSAIAINQIKEKKYYQKYLLSKKKIILVGVAIDINERNIIDWKMQTYN
ncbi:MAG: PD-(D/E)XK nuclease domain-containing protein [Bacteroidetes bacterium]|nr:PD-(D/E)XK nuclease domain-containing protein [Bacteroidota bacterium]